MSKAKALLNEEEKRMRPELDKIEEVIIKAERMISKLAKKYKGGEKRVVEEIANALEHVQECRVCLEYADEEITKAEKAK